MNLSSNRLKSLKKKFFYLLKQFRSNKHCGCVLCRGAASAGITAPAAGRDRAPANPAGADGEGQRVATN